MSTKAKFTATEAKKIGETLGIDWRRFDVEQFRMGMDVELEHGLVDLQTNVTNDDPLSTGKIALAHLNEFPDYYTRLHTMEEEAEKIHKKETGRNENETCYTFEGAAELAIKMEDDTFRTYLLATRTVQNDRIRMILKEAALDELEHKHQLEKALLAGSMESPAEMRRPVPTMHLDYFLPKKELHSASDAQEVLTYAMHLERNSVDFYTRMVQGCAGAPMSFLFERLLADESRHLKALEDMYEEHFLPQG